MSQPLVMPDGSEFVVVRSAADPERDSSQIDFTVLPRGPAPPPHVHPSQRETFTVLEGDSFEVRAGGDWRRLAPGESATVEAGEVHTFRNRGAAAVRVSTVHEPGLSFERYIRRLHATAQHLGVSSPGPRTAMAFAVLWREHGDTIRPGTPALRVAMAMMARIAPLAGIRPAP